MKTRYIVIGGTGGDRAPRGSGGRLRLRQRPLGGTRSPRACRSTSMPVGGMKVAQARAKLRSGVLEPLSRPVVANYKDRKFTLTPKAAGVGVENIQGSVNAALDASRSGNIFQRTWRDITGGKVTRDVPLRVTYSQAAIDKVAAENPRSSTSRRATRTSRTSRAGQVNPTTSENGLRVRDVTLRRALKAELLDRGDRAPVRVRTKVVAPKVSTKHLAKQSPAIIIVNRCGFKLRLYKNLKPARRTGSRSARSAWRPPRACTTSRTRPSTRPGTCPTRRGRASSPVGAAGGLPNPIKARSIGIFDGAGIHGTDATGSIGSAASHGCIRMRIPDVEALRPGARSGRLSTSLEPLYRRSAPAATPVAAKRRGCSYGEEPACR